MQRIAQQSKRAVERIRRHVVKLTILDAVLRKSGRLELPIEMLATIFKHMAQSDISVWVLEIIEYRMSERHIYNIPEAVEIWGGADEDPTRSEYLSEASQYKITGYRQVLDNF